MVLGLGGVVLARYKAHQQSMRATDFDRQLQKMLESGELEKGDACTRVPRELRRSCVILTDVVGSGAFGEV